MIEYYAYIHCRPDGSPFYVGKGTKRRAHWLKGRNNHHQNIVNKYGIENISIGKIECSSEKIALDLECGIIKCFNRMGIKLCNKTLGGENTIMSQETKNKIRQSHLGSKHYKAKPLIEITSGKSFGHILEAAIFFNISQSDVYYAAHIGSGSSKFKMGKKLKTRLGNLEFKFI